MSTAAQPDPDPSVKPADKAAVEFWLRCRMADPCKSWFTPKEVAEPCGTTPQQAGSVLASITRVPVAGYDVETRPGGRGGTRYGFRRRAEAGPTRRFWIEGGEAVRHGEEVRSGGDSR